MFDERFLALCGSAGMLVEFVIPGGFRLSSRAEGEGAACPLRMPGILFRTGVRVTFFGALRRLRRERRSRPEGRALQARVKKVTKENIEFQGIPATGAASGIFQRGVLPRRKTADLLSAALRVSNCGMACQGVPSDGTKESD